MLSLNIKGHQVLRHLSVGPKNYEGTYLVT